MPRFPECTGNLYAASSEFLPGPHLVQLTHSSLWQSAWAAYTPLHATPLSLRFSSTKQRG